MKIIYNNWGGWMGVLMNSRESLSCLCVTLRGFDLMYYQRWLKGNDTGPVAIESFVGSVREVFGASLQGLVLERYAGMAENALERCASP